MFRINTPLSRVLPLTLALSVSLLTGCNSPVTPVAAPHPSPTAVAPAPPTLTPPVTPPVTYPAPTPAPTLTLDQTAATIASSGETSFGLQVNRLPDSVTLSGQPAGLSAVYASGVLKVRAQNVLPGSYPLKVTGVWGSDLRSAELQLTVQAALPAPTPPPTPNPTPTPTPTPPTVTTTPDFALSLSVPGVALTAGQSGSANVSVQGNAAYTGGAVLSASVSPAGPGGLGVSLSDKIISLDAASAAPGQYTVTITGVLGTISHSVNLPVTVRAAPQTVTLTQNTLSLLTGATGTIAYSGGPLRQLTLETPGLITSAALQGNAILLTAGQVAGTGRVNLSLTMQDGGVQNVSVQVSVTAPAAPNPTPPAPTPGPTPPTPTAPSGYTWYPGTNRAASADELEVLRLTNAVRAKGAACGAAAYPPAPALAWDDQLAYAARNHSTDMGTRGYFEHTTPENVTFSDRISAAGFKWNRIAENIAAGYATPQAVVDGWVASPGHCTNLMNPALKKLGVGGVTLAGSPYATYWTQDFGTSP